MAEKQRQHSEAGLVGQQVAANLIRIRNARRKTTGQLAQDVSDLGVAMTASTVTKIEKQGRRVFADELVALAVALGVSPVTLMLSPQDTGELVRITTESEPVPWQRAWRWAHGQEPLPGSQEAATWAARAEWLDRNRPYMSPATIQELQGLLEAREVGVGPFRVELEHDGEKWIKAEMTQSGHRKEEDHGTSG